ncbi:eukaryotic translation initiation factor 4 gamma-like [Lathyrus oleraceus]|uniref:eukaryotic translation initiation factor 4 gamma-like n=1 Tax=Pisum sativum TaxID=3888 RepID=UPI0021CE759A|nr:eukaryotic translation initiation factor 4 gamma-like [Pisum sativum]
MAFEDFKLKGLSEQVRNDFIKDAGERLQERLVRVVEEKASREAEEKARLEEEQRVREAEEKVVAEAAAAAAEAEAKAKADAEEASHIAAKEAAKANTGALNQGEKSNSSFAPLVLKTLEEL